jgi:hypothetical protein
MNGNTAAAWVRKLVITASAGMFAMAMFPAVSRGDQPAPQLKFANGRFEPASININAGAPAQLTVVNQGDSAIEFESFELNRERVVPPGGSIVVRLPKLDPGQYHFFDDFHHDAGQGTITAQ